MEVRRDEGALSHPLGRRPFSRAVGRRGAKGSREHSSVPLTSPAQLCFSGSNSISTGVVAATQGRAMESAEPEEATRLELARCWPRHDTPAPNWPCRPRTCGCLSAYGQTGAGRVRRQKRSYQATSDQTSDRTASTLCHRQYLVPGTSTSTCTCTSLQVPVSSRYQVPYAAGTGTGSSLCCKSSLYFI